jgi:hypothetical protein
MKNLIKEDVDVFVRFFFNNYFCTHINKAWQMIQFSLMVLFELATPGHLG